MQNIPTSSANPSLSHPAGAIHPEAESFERDGKVVLSRNRLTPSEKLALARICINHGGDYSIKGGRERFWAKIQALFTNEIGRPCGNPRPVMSRMLADYEVKMTREEKETGTAQKDGEYEQTMREWKSRVNGVCILPADISEAV
jgi:hypothetical protein